MTVPHPDTDPPLPAAGTARLRERLARAGAEWPDRTLEVLHDGPHARYVAVPRRSGAAWALGLLGSDAVGVPCGVRVAASEVAELGTCRLRNGQLYVGTRRLRIGRLVDLRVPRLHPPDRIDPADNAADDPATAGRLADLVGRGDGLTPYGDDVVCGWLATRRAYGISTPNADAAIRARLDATSTLSATLIEAAMAGEAIAEFNCWLSADDADRAAARKRLAAVGGSSGRGLIEGAEAALASITSTGRDAA